MQQENDIRSRSVNPSGDPGQYSSSGFSASDDRRHSVPTGLSSADQNSQNHDGSYVSGANARSLTQQQALQQQVQDLSPPMENTRLTGLHILGLPSAATPEPISRAHTPPILNGRPLPAGPDSGVDNIWTPIGTRTPGSFSQRELPSDAREDAAGIQPVTIPRPRSAASSFHHRYPSQLSAGSDGDGLRQSHSYLQFHQQPSAARQLFSHSQAGSSHSRQTPSDTLADLNSPESSLAHHRRHSSLNRAARPLPAELFYPERGPQQTNDSLRPMSRSRSYNTVARGERQSSASPTGFFRSFASTPGPPAAPTDLLKMRRHSTIIDRGGQAALLASGDGRRYEQREGPGPQGAAADHDSFLLASGLSAGDQGDQHLSAGISDSGSTYQQVFLQGGEDGSLPAQRRFGPSVSTQSLRPAGSSSHSTNQQIGKPTPDPHRRRTAHAVQTSAHYTLPSSQASFQGDSQHHRLSPYNLRQLGNSATGEPVARPQHRHTNNFERESQLSLDSALATGGSHFRGRSSSSMAPGVLSSRNSLYDLSGMRASTAAGSVGVTVGSPLEVRSQHSGSHNGLHQSTAGMSLAPGASNRSAWGGSGENHRIVPSPGMDPDPAAHPDPANLAVPHSHTGGGNQRRHSSPPGLVSDVGRYRNQAVEIIQDSLIEEPAAEEAAEALLQQRTVIDLDLSAASVPPTTNAGGGGRNNTAAPKPSGPPDDQIPQTESVEAASAPQEGGTEAVAAAPAVEAESAIAPAPPAATAAESSHKLQRKQSAESDPRTQAPPKYAHLRLRAGSNASQQTGHRSGGMYYPQASPMEAHAPPPAYFYHSSAYSQPISPTAVAYRYLVSPRPLLQGGGGDYPPPLDVQQHHPQDPHHSPHHPPPPAEYLVPVNYIPYGQDMNSSAPHSPPLYHLPIPHDSGKMSPLHQMHHPSMNPAHLAHFSPVYSPTGVPMHPHDAQHPPSANHGSGHPGFNHSPTGLMLPHTSPGLVSQYPPGAQPQNLQLLPSYAPPPSDPNHPPYHQYQQPHHPEYPAISPDHPNHSPSNHSGPPQFFQVPSPELPAQSPPHQTWQQTPLYYPQPPHSAYPSYQGPPQPSAAPVRGGPPPPPAGNPPVQHGSSGPHLSFKTGPPEPSRAADKSSAVPSRKLPKPAPTGPTDSHPSHRPAAAKESVTRSSQTPSEPRRSQTPTLLPGQPSSSTEPYELPHRGSDLLDFARTQVGSRALQQQVDRDGILAVQHLLDELLPFLPVLITDPFGNYLCQKIIRESSNRQRELFLSTVLPEIVIMSCDHQGTRVIQRLIRHLSDPLHKQMLVLALAGDTDLALRLAEAWRRRHPFTKLDFLHPAEEKKIRTAVTAAAEAEAGGGGSTLGRGGEDGHPGLAADPQRKELEEKEELGGVPPKSSFSSSSSDSAQEPAELVDFRPLLQSLVESQDLRSLDDPERIRKQYQNLCALMQESYATHVVAAMLTHFVREPEVPPDAPVAHRTSLPPPPSGAGSGNSNRGGKRNRSTQSKHSSSGSEETDSRDHSAPLDYHPVQNPGDGKPGGDVRNAGRHRHILWPVLDAAESDILHLATNSHGVCILKQCLSLTPDPPFLESLQRISQHAVELARHEFGNYLLQHVVEVCQRRPLQVLEHCERLLHDRLAAFYVSLSLEKFSSNVVECFLKLGRPPLRRAVIQVLKTEEAVRELVQQDSFGNYVLQNVMVAMEPSEAIELARIVRPLLQRNPNLRPAMKKKWARLLSHIPETPDFHDLPEPPSHPSETQLTNGDPSAAPNADPSVIPQQMTPTPPGSNHTTPSKAVSAAAEVNAPRSVEEQQQRLKQPRQTHHNHHHQHRHQQQQQQQQQKRNRNRASGNVVRSTVSTPAWQQPHPQQLQQAPPSLHYAALPPPQQFSAPHYSAGHRHHPHPSQHPPQLPPQQQQQQQYHRAAPYPRPPHHPVPQQQHHPQYPLPAPHSRPLHHPQHQHHPQNQPQQHHPLHAAPLPYLQFHPSQAPPPLHMMQAPPNQPRRRQNQRRNKTRGNSNNAGQTRQRRSRH